MHNEQTFPTGDNASNQDSLFVVCYRVIISHIKVYCNGGGNTLSCEVQLKANRLDYKLINFTSCKILLRVVTTNIRIQAAYIGSSH